MVLGLMIAATGMLYAQEKPAETVDNSANNGDAPPGNAMSLSVRQARVNLKQATKNAYIGSLKSCFLWSCVIMEFQPIDFRFTAVGFTVSTPYIFNSPGVKHLHDLKYTVDFSKAKDYARSFNIPKSTCSTGNCYGVGGLIHPTLHEIGALVWSDESEAQGFADAFNRLVYAARHREIEERFAAFRTAAKAWRENPAKPSLGAEADQQRALAENAIKEKNPESAIDHFEIAVEMQPMWPAGWFNLAVIYAEQNDYADAADRMKHYLELAPEASDAQQARDQMTTWVGKLEEQAKNEKLGMHETITSLKKKPNLAQADARSFEPVYGQKRDDEPRTKPRPPAAAIHASYSAPQHMSPSPSAGLYTLDARVGFDTLDGVSYNPAQGTLTLFGHRTRSDSGTYGHYLDLLAAALDSNKPTFSLEWTPSSERDVDRAMASFADDRNNDSLTTQLANIFDASGHLNRRGASFFRALGVDAREGMNRYEFNSSMLTASGRPNAGAALRAFGEWMEATKRNDQAGIKSGLENTIDAAGIYDFVAAQAARSRNGEISEDQLMDLVMPRLVGALATTFGWSDGPYTDKYWRLRRSGNSWVDAGNGVMWDLQMELNTLPRKTLDILAARAGEIVVPSDVMREVLGVEPRVHPVLSGLSGNTRLALTACDADVFAKKLFDMPGLKAKVPRYQGFFSWLQDRGEHSATDEGHLWISPGDFELLESTDKQTLRFGRTPMKFHIETYDSRRRSVSNPQLSAYADLLTSVYDDIAREYPVLHQLRESTKMVAVAQWLKQRGYSVTLPRAGREVVNLPEELPGAMYLVMAVKQGPVGESLTAAGGIDFGGDGAWRFAPRDTPSAQTDLVDQTGRHVREKLEQLSGKKFEVPMPQPLAEVKDEEIGGQQFATVTVAVGAASENSDTAVQLVPSPDRKAQGLWRSNDLAAAESAYGKLIEAASGNPCQAASYMAIKAQILHEKGDSTTAIQTLNAARNMCTQSPSFDAVLDLMRAMACYESGDLQCAKQALSDAIALDPKNTSAARIRAKLEEPQNAGSGAPAIAVADVYKAIRDVSPLNGTDEQIKGAGFNPSITVDRLALTSRAQTPDSQRIDIEKYEKTRSDAQIRQMKIDHDNFLARQKMKADTADKLQKLAADADDNRKSELAAQADKLKAESDRDAAEANKLDVKIQERAHMLIDIEVQPTPPEQENQKAPMAAPVTKP
jgi:tetratricopeptide (TPR) repeat protein